ncbi:reverse transcriptase domain-containing protein [Tanacetum coccineum]
MMRSSYIFVAMEPWSVDQTKSGPGCLECMYFVDDVHRPPGLDYVSCTWAQAQQSNRKTQWTKTKPRPTGNDPETARRTESFHRTLLQDKRKLISDEALREYCDRNYHQILPIIAEKVHQEKVQQEKLKAVKARLNFEETSRHSESGTPIKRRGLKERLGPRYVHSRSGSPEPRHDRPGSPKKKGPERKAMFRRLEKDVFHRLGDKGKSASVHSDDSRRSAPEGRCHKRTSSRRTDELSESESSAGDHWKSKLKRQKSDIEDNLSQPWVCEETDHFTPRICYFDFSKTRMPSHIKTYDGSEDPEDHLMIFQSAAKTERWAMPTWCHMFNSTLTGNAIVWFDDLPKETIDSYDDLKKSFLENYLQQKKCIKDPVEIHNIRQRDGESKEEFVRSEVGHNTDVCMHLRKHIEEMLKAGKLSHLIKELKQNNRNEQPKATKKGETSGKDKALAILMDEGTKGPMIIEAEIGGHYIHCMYVDSESASEILANTTIGNNWRRRALRFSLDEFCSREVTIPVQRNYWKTRSQEVTCSSVNSSRNAKDPGDKGNWQKSGSVVIRNRTEDEIVRDIEETFKTLREINMKLNPKKCTFGVEEGMFLGYKVNSKGLKVCPDKVDAVLSLPSPKCLKDVQKLNGKLASLNRFLAKSAEKSLPFFKTLKKCTKKSDFHWTTEAEEAFKQMKQLIAELPMLTAPMEKEELIVYLAAAKETVSAVLMTEREAKQMPIYFVSRALRSPELNYTSMKKLVLALVHASKRLKRYFQAHPIIVITDQPIQQILSRPEVAGRLQKWSIELGEYAIHYKLKVSVKGHILAYFIVERPKEDSPDTPMEEEEELPEPWILFTDGSSCTGRSGAGLILTNPEGMEFTYALRFRFDATNNEAKYEALIAGLRITEQMGVKNLQANVDSRLVANQVNGTFAHLSKQVLVEELKEKSISEVEVLAVVEEEGDTWMTPIYKYLAEETLPADMRKARAIRRKSWRFAVINGILYKKSFLGLWLRCVGPLQANYILREIHEGSCNMYAGTRSIVAKALRTGYYWPTMHRDARALIRACQDCQVHKPILRNPQQKLNLITSTWPFYKWRINVVEPFPEGPKKVKFIIVAMDYFTKWIEAKPIATITGNLIKKFVWDNIVCRFGLPGEIISDNGKQF